MPTLYITHPACLDHDTGPGHPERADRLRAIETALESQRFAHLVREQAEKASLEAIGRVHPARYIDAIHAASPDEGLIHVDPDTVMSPGSWRAALLAAGGVMQAVDEVMTGKSRNAFCALRPPGHHAEASRAMGFCLFNNVAVAAHHARAAHDAERVAVLDFDVHHGNGTQAIFWPDENMFYGSTHQMPLFPGTGAVTETGVGNICNAPLKAGDGGAAFREAWRTRVLPELEAFAPDLIMISAGFDAHWRDPLASLELTEDDFDWITRALLEIAETHCGGRVVSVLEGGYDLDALAKSVDVHVSALMESAV